MQSKCHTSTGVRETGPARVADDTLLDAARDCVLASGLRRTTLSAVARAAGVSRMTLYRRFPDITSLIAALMTREFAALLQRASASAAGTTTRSRLVDTALAAVIALTEDPLLRGILDNDASVLLPYLVERIGSTQRFAERFLCEQLASGHADGSVRHADVAAQSRSFFLTVTAFVLALRPATTDVGRHTLLTELRAQLDGALRPQNDHPSPEAP